MATSHKSILFRVAGSTDDNTSEREQGMNVIVAGCSLDLTEDDIVLYFPPLSLLRFAG